MDMKTTHTLGTWTPKTEPFEAPEIVEVEQVKITPPEPGYPRTARVLIRRSRNWQVYEISEEITFPAEATPHERDAAITKTHRALVSMSLRGLDEVCHGEQAARDGNGRGRA
jgi:hypothetical protein